MKKIINGKVYDTETAQELTSWANTWDTRDLHHITETLYRKRTGEYFLHGEGGPMTQYARRSISQNEWSGGEKIIPLSAENARKWAEEHLDGNEYESIFGLPDEDAEPVMLSVMLPADLSALIRQKAVEKGISLTAYVEWALRSTL